MGGQKPTQKLHLRSIKFSCDRSAAEILCAAEEDIDK